MSGAIIYRGVGGFVLEIGQETLFIPAETAFGMAEFILATDRASMDAPIRHQSIEITEAGKAALAVDKSRLPER